MHHPGCTLKQAVRQTEVHVKCCLESGQLSHYKIKCLHPSPSPGSFPPNLSYHKSKPLPPSSSSSSQPSTAVLVCSMRQHCHAVDPTNSNPLEVHSSQGLTFPSGDSNRAASGIFDSIEGGEVSVPFKAAAATARIPSNCFPLFLA